MIFLVVWLQQKSYLFIPSNLRKILYICSDWPFLHFDVTPSDAYMRRLGIEFLGDGKMIFICTLLSNNTKITQSFCSNLHSRPRVYIKCGDVYLLKQKKLSPNVGLEPTTLRLRVSCSTDWASRATGTKPYRDPFNFVFYYRAALRRVTLLLGLSWHRCSHLK